MIAVSCQAPNPFHAVGFLSDLNDPTRDQTTAEPDESKLRVWIGAKEGQDYAYLTRSSCDNSAPAYQWQFNLASLYTTFPVTISVPKPSQQQGKYKLSFAESSVTFDNLNEIGLEELVGSSQVICQTWQSQDTEIYTKSWHRLKPVFANFIARAYPACDNLQLKDDTWQCDNPKYELSDLRKNLLLTKENILKRWKRQPYLLARRLTLSEQLAASLSHEDARENSALTRFCAVAKSSLPLEKPLVMHSPLWLSKVCSGSKSVRHQMALNGLHSAVQELGYFLQLGDNATSPGSLQVKLPFEREDQKMLWVKLSAGDEVTDALIEKGIKIAFSDRQIVDQDGYWHPLFSQDPMVMGLATFIGLTQAKQEPAGLLADAEDHKAAGRFLANSLIGETSFSLPNGKAKTLRLPHGMYNYELYYYQHLDRWWQPNAQEIQATGSISWNQNTPRLSIKEEPSIRSR